MTDVDPRPLDGAAMLRTLADAGVEYLIIGGIAFGYHVQPRATKDLDIVPAPDRENLRRLLDALERLEARMLPLDIPEHGGTLTVDWLAEGGNFQFTTSCGRLDVMQWVAKRAYADLAPEAIDDRVLGIPVRVCSFDDLVALKEAAGRDQDVVDLRRLREVREGGPAE